MTIDEVTAIAGDALFLIIKISALYCLYLW